MVALLQKVRKKIRGIRRIPDNKEYESVKLLAHWEGLNVVTAEKAKGGKFNRYPCLCRLTFTEGPNCESNYLLRICIVFVLYLLEIVLSP